MENVLVCMANGHADAFIVVDKEAPTFRSSLSIVDI